jgi:nickel transport protein
VLALAGALAVPTIAHAHRLEAEATVRPFGIVQVESWFETGDIPKSARVGVYRADGSRLTEGKVDANGYFVFKYASVEPLRVVVDAGAGHRAEFPIKTRDLVEAAVGSWAACAIPTGTSSCVTAALLHEPGEGPAPTPVPTAEHPTGPQYGKLALGVGLLLTVAAGAMFFRKVRRFQR